LLITGTAILGGKLLKEISQNSKEKSQEILYHYVITPDLNMNECPAPGNAVEMRSYFLHNF